MYNQTSSDFITILAGILSIILIITFFVIAFRLKKIMEYSAYVKKYTNKQASKSGIIYHVICQNCNKPNEVWQGEPVPFHCYNCHDPLKPAEIKENSTENKL